MRTLRLQDIESIAAAGVHWKPLRRELGITAFRTNAYAADAGEQLIEDHAEDDEEELYVLVTGAATFVVDGEEISATPGTVVFLPDPEALACIKALAGERAAALAHWRRAVALNPKAREWAEGDPELDAIRDSL